MIAKIQTQVESYFNGAKVIASSPRNDDKHFAVLVVSDVFEHKSLIERHRMVYDALGHLMDELHAINITAQTVSEYEIQ